MSTVSPKIAERAFQVDPVSLPSPFGSTGTWPMVPGMAAPLGLAEFMLARATKDVAAGQQMMACRTLGELQAVQADYLQGMAEDYMIGLPKALLGSVAVGAPQSGLSGDHADDHMGV